MAQPKPVVKAPSESVGVTDVEKARDAVNAAEVALLAKINAPRSKPGELNTLTTKFFDSLVTLNDKLKPANGGKDAIPITGTSTDERSRSFNTWLGLDPAAPITTDTMKAFDRKMVDVYSIAPAAGAKAALDSIRDAEAARVAAGTKAPLPIPVPVAAEGTLAEKVAPTISDLDYVIANTKKNSGENKQAVAYKAYLEAAAKASAARQKANQKATDAKIAAAEKFLKGDGDKDIGAVARAAQSASDTAIAAYKSIANATDDPFITEYTALWNTVATGTGTKADIRNMLPDLFLLGAEPRARAFKMLKDAAALDDAQAAPKVQEAKAYVESEQKLMARLLKDFVVDPEDKAVADIKAAGLPTYADLQKQERTDKVSSGTYAMRGKKNGSDELAAVASARAKAARELLVPGKKISYYEVSALYDGATSDAKAIKAIIDAYNFAKPRLAATTDRSTRAMFWRGYARATKMIVDPNYNMYADLSKQQRRQIIALHLNIPLEDALDTRKFTDKMVADGEKKLVGVFMRSHDERRNSAMNELYGGMSGLITSSTDPQLAQMARYRSLRISVYDSYYKYVSRFDTTNGTIINDDVLQEQRRFDVAREFLTDVVAAAKDAAAKDPKVIEAAAKVAAAKTPAEKAAAQKEADALVDPMVKNAEAWLAATATTKPTAEQIPVYSDMLYEMAWGMSAIKEAELWIANSSLQSKGVDKAKLDAAKSYVQTARRLFAMDFSGANEKPDLQVLPSFHFNLSTSWADAAVNTLAPPAFAITDGPANMDTRGLYLNPIAADGSMISNPTAAQRKDGAVLGELRHLTLLSLVRDNAAFGIPTSDAALNAGLGGPFAGLSFKYSRAPKILKSEPPRRTSVRPIDAHTTFDVRKGVKLSPDVHETIDLYPAGQLFVQWNRLNQLHGDASAPDLLVSMNVAPNSIADAGLKAKAARIATRLGLPLDKPFLDSVRAKMQDVSIDYANKAPEQEQEAMNNLLLGVLEYRIAELDSRLKGSIDIGGKKVPLTDIARYKHPRAAYAKDAIEALGMLQGPDGKGGLLAGFAAGSKTDLSSRQLNPNYAIALAEKAIKSLDPDNFKPVPYEDVKPPIASEPVEYIATVRSEQIWVSGVRYGKFTADITAYVGKDADLAKRQKLTMDDYAKKRGSPVPMEYAWIGYETFPGDVTMVANPKRADPTWDGTGGAFVGRVMRNIRLPDGSTGDAVVRVEKRTERSGSDYSSAMDYEAMKINGQYDVLYQLHKPEGDQPSFMPVSVNDRARRMCMKTQGRSFAFPSGAEPHAIVLPLVSE